MSINLEIVCVIFLKVNSQSHDPSRSRTQSIIALEWRGGTCPWNVRLVRSWHNLLVVRCKEGERIYIHRCWMQRTECGENTLNRCVWVAWLIAVCKLEEASSRSPSTGSNPIHWSWLLCLSYHTSSENHDDKGVPLTKATKSSQSCSRAKAEIFN